MPILKYKVLNPLTNCKEAYYDLKKQLLIFPVEDRYRYFVECSLYNERLGYDEYFILLGKDRFDENCRLCETTMYGKVKCKVSGELKDYLVRETMERGNIKVDYVESSDTYDVFKIV